MGSSPCRCCGALGLEGKPTGHFRPSDAKRDVAQRAPEQRCLTGEPQAVVARRAANCLTVPQLGSCPRRSGRPCAGQVMTSYFASIAFHPHQPSVGSNRRLRGRGHSEKCVVWQPAQRCIDGSHLQGRYTMNGYALSATLALASVAAFAFTQSATHAPPSGSMDRAMMGRGMLGGEMMGRDMMGRDMMVGSMARRHEAMIHGIPEPYRSARDPLPENAATLTRGAQVYLEDCAACHGPKGYGDGPAAQQLSPPPANLTWLAHSRMFGEQYAYWTVAEGGRPVGSAMPAFKGNLSQQDIWAVVSYLRNGLAMPPRR